jgi:hypothetical protein
MPRGGVRPNSGRKTLLDEGVKMACLSKCWCHLLAKMNNESVSDDEKTKIALALCPKTIIQKLEHDSPNGGIKLILVDNKQVQLGGDKA